MITDEDRTAYRLKGYNCLIKFIDGEELLLKVDGSEDEITDWFEDANRFLNGDIEGILSNLAINRTTVKYIKTI